MQGFADIIVERALALREKCVPGRAIDIVKEVEIFTWNALVEIIVGRGVVVPRYVGEDILNFQKLYLILDILPGRQLLKRLPFPAFRRGYKSLGMLDDAFHDSMQRARESSYSGGDVMTHYVRARDQEGAAGTLDNDRAIRDEMLILLSAFVDAPVGAIAFGLDVLARNPVLRERLEREVDEVLGDREIEAADFHRLPYAQAFLSELLRLEPPPAVLLPKETLEDRTVGGYLIPKGTLVHIGLRELHHQAANWKDASEFKPERWLENPPPPQPPCPAHGYIPFGIGPHSCRGTAVAQRICVLALACLAQRVRLEPKSSAPLKRNELAVGVKGPWMVDVRARQEPS